MQITPRIRMVGTRPMLILEQIKKELKPSDEDLQLMKDRLNKASSDELERTYQAFERFGVEVIMECVRRSYGK